MVFLSATLGDPARTISAFGRQVVVAALPIVVDFSTDLGSVAVPSRYRFLIVVFTFAVIVHVAACQGYGALERVVAHAARHTRAPDLDALAHRKLNFRRRMSNACHHQ